MTADIVPLGHKPRVVEVVGADDEERVRPQTLRELAIERCADRIERAMRTRLTFDERIGLERALDELVDEVEWHGRRERW